MCTYLYINIGELIGNGPQDIGVNCLALNCSLGIRHGVHLLAGAASPHPCLLVTPDGRAFFREIGTYWYLFRRQDKYLVLIATIYIYIYIYIYIV
jgi:hypothetical protein